MPKLDYACSTMTMLVECACRYSLGRFSYQPHAFIMDVTPMLPYLNNDAIGCMERDIREYLTRIANSNEKDSYFGQWLDFRQLLLKEIVKRGIEQWN